MTGRVVRWLTAALLVLVVGAGIAAFLDRRDRPRPLPPGITGTLVFVSDRQGVDALYVRRLPAGQDRLLVSLAGPVGQPALSPDGRLVAFSSAGRVGMVTLATGQLRIATPGTEWLDGSPCWSPDGKAFVVSARRRDQTRTDVHLIRLREGSEPERQILTQTAGLDETNPVVSPDGSFVVFEREEGLVRLDLKDSRSRRLTTGFRKLHWPRFLPSGRIVCLWSAGKQYGIEVMDADGRNRETLSEGSVFYRTLSPSPDGRFIAATFAFDLSFHPLDALKVRQTEEVRLLDAQGAPLAVLSRSWRDSNHSPTWGP